MNLLNRQQLTVLTEEVAKIVTDTTGEAGAYAEEFARYVAGFLASLITSPDPDALRRLRAQAQAVGETIAEIGDQNLKRILERLEDAARLLLAVAQVGA